MEHTADTGIAVRAPTPEACFARAAAGMLSTFVPAVHGSHQVDLDVRGSGRLDLLVAWLEEVLFRGEIKRLALTEVTVTKLTRSRITGFARGAPFGRAVSPVGPLVKGVSRHGLELRHVGAMWLARIILDV